MQVAVETTYEVVSDTDKKQDPMFNILGKKVKQDESTVRKKVCRFINKNENKIKQRFNTDQKPKPIEFLKMIVKEILK